MATARASATRHLIVSLRNCLRGEAGGALRDAAAVSAADAEKEVATPVEETGAEGGGAPTRLRAARAPRHRRAGQPKTPRWVTAGKERRGRLK